MILVGVLEINQEYHDIIYARVSRPFHNSLHQSIATSGRKSQNLTPPWT